VTTLQDLLDLLPDNSTGDIDAADLRTVVTDLWNQTVGVETEVTGNADAVALWAATTNARIDALEEATGGDRTVSAVYRLDAAPSGDPSGGEVTTNTGALATASSLRFAALDRNGVDLTNLFASGVTKVSAQDKDNASNWAKWTVAGAATSPSMGDFDLAVTLVSSAGTLTAGQNNDLVFVFSYPAA